MRRFSEATTQQPKGLYSNLPIGVVGVVAVRKVESLLRE